MVSCTKRDHEYSLAGSLAASPYIHTCECPHSAGTLVHNWPLRDSLFPTIRFPLGTLSLSLLSRSGSAGHWLGPHHPATTRRIWIPPCPCSPHSVRTTLKATVTKSPWGALWPNVQHAEAKPTPPTAVTPLTKPTHTQQAMVTPWEWHLQSTACTTLQSSHGSLKAYSFWTDLGLPGLTISLPDPYPMGARPKAFPWAFPLSTGRKK